MAAVVVQGQGMRITPEQEVQIKAIIAAMKCPKEYHCYRSSFRIVGRARLIGDTDVVECLAEQASVCPYGVPFGNTFFCSCPLRKYILETFGR